MIYIIIMVQLKFHLIFINLSLEFVKYINNGI
jgi:hypothetical protein